MTYNFPFETRRDRERKCGWRQPGGKYLIGGECCLPCGKLPHWLTVCPTCHHGIKPSRGWTWIDADALFGNLPCGTRDVSRNEFCLSCVLHHPGQRAGLLWIGEKFYTPDEFEAEATRLGISRRIASVATGFKVGETLVLLASRKVMCVGATGSGELVSYKPAIFAAFVPTAIEYVVKGDETDEQLHRLEAQGCTLVRVERVTDDQDDSQQPADDTASVEAR